MYRIKCRNALEHELEEREAERDETAAQKGRKQAVYDDKTNEGG